MEVTQLPHRLFDIFLQVKWGKSIYRITKSRQCVRPDIVHTMVSYILVSLMMHSEQLEQVILFITYL